MGDGELWVAEGGEKMRDHPKDSTWSFQYAPIPKSIELSHQIVDKDLSQPQLGQSLRSHHQHILPPILLLSPPRDIRNVLIRNRRRNSFEEWCGIVLLAPYVLGIEAVVSPSDVLPDSVERGVQKIVKTSIRFTTFLVKFAYRLAREHPKRVHEVHREIFHGVIQLLDFSWAGWTLAFRLRYPQIRRLGFDAAEDEVDDRFVNLGGALSADKSKFVPEMLDEIFWEERGEFSGNGR